MAGDEQNNIWPLPKFHFSVDITDVGEDLAFQEVSGLEVTSEPIEYRAGNSKVFSTIKMPGIVNTGNVTLKKGIFAKDNRFWDWYSKIKLNTISRQTVTIKLLDEGGNPTMVWTLANAFPTKITGTDLSANGNEVAVESIELAHEGLTIENA